MNNTKQRKNILTASEVCDLIKVSGESGVCELKFGELHVLFAPTEIGRPALGEFSPEQSAAVQELSELKDQVQDQEDMIQELNLSDPAEFERQIALGELEDERSRP